MENKYWNVLAVSKNSLFNWILCCGIIFLPIQCWSVQASLNNVTAMKFNDYSRIIFKVSAGTNKYHVFTLANPDRLVVDFDKASLRTDIKHLNLDDSLIKSARSGRPVSSMLRIVFDLSQPIRVKSFFATESKEAQLVVDVYPTGSKPKTVTNSAAVTQTIPVPLAETAPAENVLAKLAINDIKKLPAATKTRPIVLKEFDLVDAKKQPQLQAVEILKKRRLIIVVDAGHGGKDSGTIGQQGTKEKDVVLKIALRLAELINQDPSLRASLTRRGDYFVSLRDRLRIARRDKADLFLAIHADSYFDNRSTGASVYALSQHGASSMAARWLADKENHSELGGVNLDNLGDRSVLLRSVLIDLSETATIVDSVKLGTDMLSALESVTSLHYSRVEQAPFMVLKSPDIPSVLVEMGFLSNASEEDHLRDAAYRDKLARALLAGIHQYVATHPMMASNSRPATAIIPI
jgi:N-acetylmuramoyl-L-alanine amidase